MSAFDGGGGLKPIFGNKKVGAAVHLVVTAACTYAGFALGLPPVLIVGLCGGGIGYLGGKLVAAGSTNPKIAAAAKAAPDDVPPGMP